MAIAPDFWEPEHGGTAVMLAGASDVPRAGQGASPPGGLGVTSQGYGQEGYILDESEHLGPQPKPPPEMESFVVGVPYYLPFATPYRDSWEIFRDDPVSVKQLISMRRQDGQARALFRLMTMPIMAALKDAAVVAAEDEDGGEEEAEFCKKLLFLPPNAGGMTIPLTRFVKQMVLALFNGFSAWEMVYWSPKVGPLKGKWTIRKLDWRPSETLTFLLDGQGEFNGFRQRTFFQGRTIDVKIPKNTAVYYANEEAERPFYGVSMFESAFYHYDKKVKLYYIAHLAAQRSAVGLRIGTMPPNPPRSDKNNFVNALSQLGLAQFMTCPSADWVVTSLQESQGRFDFLGLINHHNSQMSKSVLAAFFDEQQGAGSGESTLIDYGQQSDATWLMLLEAVLGEMAEVITNQILPRFVDWNFGTGKYPTWKWGQLTAEQKAAVQDTFDKLAGAGPTANVTPEFMLELEKKLATELGLEIDYDKIEADREKQQQLQAQQASAQNQAAMAASQQPPPGAGQPPQQPGPGAGQQPPGGGGPPAAPPANPFGGASGGTSSGGPGSGPGGPGSLYGKFSRDDVRDAVTDLILGDLGEYGD